MAGDARPGIVADAAALGEVDGIVDPRDGAGIGHRAEATGDVDAGALGSQVGNRAARGVRHETASKEPDSIIDLGCDTAGIYQGADPGGDSDPVLAPDDGARVGHRAAAI